MRPSTGKPGAQPPAGPAWLVLPARAVALIVVVPLRLVYELVRLTGRGVAAVLDLLIVRPLRWCGRGAGWLAAWIHRTLLVPAGGFLAEVGRGIGRLLESVLLRPLRLLGGGLARLLAVLVVAPAALLWRCVLRPPLAGLAWLAGQVWSGIAAGIAWAARILIGVPLGILWRHVLAPVLAALAGTWRLAARVLRWLWRTLVAAPFRVLVAEPARWTRANVLRPAGRGVRQMWRVSVREPAGSARRLFRGH